MLYKTVSLAFAAQAVSGYNMAMPSKMAASRVARAGPVEMAKKSVCAVPCADRQTSCCCCLRLSLPIGSLPPAWHVR